MRAKITRRWDAVQPGEVYPTTFKPGDIVEGELAQMALEAKAGEPAGDRPGADTTQQKETPALRAKVKKGVDGFAEGAVVEGDEARHLIEAGKAVLIKDKGPAPERK